MTLLAPTVVANGVAGVGTHTDTLHTGRPLREGGLPQVTSSSLSSRDRFRRSTKRSNTTLLFDLGLGQLLILECKVLVVFLVSKTQNFIALFYLGTAWSWLTVPLRKSTNCSASQEQSQGFPSSLILVDWRELNT